MTLATGTRTVRLGAREVGSGLPSFVVAEAGVNHNGDLELARRLVAAAAAAGADAVKFQTYQTERLVTPSAPLADYQRRSTAPGESQFELLRRCELAPESFAELQRCARDHGILFLSSPFDAASADVLDGLDVPAFKVGSGELTNLLFLAHVARTGRPLVLSTGMAGLAEVDEAVRTVRAAGNEDLVLLHCVSCYPADPATVNLRAMETMRSAFGVPVGFSDHTPGVAVACAAVALGACLVEKHLTLDRSLPGPDHEASLEPAEFGELVRSLRVVESSLGDGCKRPSPAEADTARAARRSLVARRSIPAGSRLTEDALATLRPGTGLPPSFLPHVLGRVARVAIPAGTLISLDMLT